MPSILAKRLAKLTATAWNTQQISYENTSRIRRTKPCADMNEIKKKMQKSIDLLKGQVVGIRSNISASVVDTVRLEYYGQMYPLKELAFAANTTAGVTITPYDPSLVSQIEKTLKQAGFQAYVFSKQSVVVSVPPPSVEQKKEIHKHIKSLGEETKVAIRNIRKQTKQEWSRQDISESQLKGMEKQLQALTDECVALTDSIVAEKIQNCN